MRPRVDRRLLAPILLVLLLAGWAARPWLAQARWHLQGAVEVALLPRFSGAAAVAPPRHIAHAGGAYRNRTYTNSLAALEHNYRRGGRWFEVDFLSDAQGRWWAVHTWDEAVDPPAALEQILAWLEAHSEARLVTDTKDDARALFDRLEAAAPPPLRARIHPQIYRIAEYAAARAGAFGLPIFTTYRSRYPWWVLRRFALGQPLLGVAVTRDEAMEAGRALAAAVPVLTHTVNDAAEADRLAAAGIAGIYTDDLLP